MARAAQPLRRRQGRGAHRRPVPPVSGDGGISRQASPSTESEKTACQEKLTWNSRGVPLVWKEADPSGRALSPGRFETWASGARSGHWGGPTTFIDTTLIGPPAATIGIGAAERRPATEAAGTGTATVVRDDPWSRGGSPRKAVRGGAVPRSSVGYSPGFDPAPAGPASRGRRGCPLPPERTPPFGHPNSRFGTAPRAEESVS